MNTRMPRLLRRAPVVLRILIGVVGLIGVASSAMAGALFGVSACGPQTYGPPCSVSGLSWIPLLVGGVIFVTFAGFPSRFWAIPAVWTLTLAGTWIVGHVSDAAFAIVGTVLGVLVLVGTVLIEVRHTTPRRGGAR